jgi:deazaflavin-dependent oxidoreductase (nitroreductase family)
MTPLLSSDATRALARDKVIDITTLGARTEQPRRIELWFHRVAGKVYLSGSPGTRNWYANLLAHPGFTFHLKDSAHVDLPAQARLITEPAERRRIMAQILGPGHDAAKLDAWGAGSPLVEVQFT